MCDSGPAGLFAALSMAEAGLPVVLLERGQPVETRGYDIGALMVRKRLNPESNLCYGACACFIALGCAAEPTQDTEIPTLIAGLKPELIELAVGSDKSGVFGGWRLRTLRGWFSQRAGQTCVGHSAALLC